MRSFRVSTTAAIVALMALALSAASAAAQTTGQPIRLTAWAVNMSNVATGANATIDIRVDTWSPDSERQQLIDIFLDKGQNALLSALQKLPAKGRINTPGRQGPDPTNTRLGWTLRFAMQWPGEDGGQRVLLATDRVMSFAEARNQPRSADYPFTFLEIHLNKDDTGEGKLAVATQLKFDKKKNTIVFENYSSEPVRLTNVKPVK